MAPRRWEGSAVCRARCGGGGAFAAYRRGSQRRYVWVFFPQCLAPGNKLDLKFGYPASKAEIYLSSTENEAKSIGITRNVWQGSLRDCLGTVKFHRNTNEKLSVVANKNVTLFLKKSVTSSLLQMVEDKSAYITHKELVDMAPNKSSIMRAILAEATDVSTHDIKAYVVQHQESHSRLMKADPVGTEEASAHAAHLNRLLDGLSLEQKLAMNYLFSTWEDRTKATAKDVFKVGLKLSNDLSSNDGVLAASAALGQI